AARGSIPAGKTFGTHHVTAMGAASGATKTMTLPAPATIDLSPTEGLVGTVVSITSASGWVPGESVQLFLGTSQLPDIVADSSGSVAGTLTIPQRQPGDVLVKLADQVLAVSAQMNFDVLDATCSPAFVPADAPYLMTRMADCPDGTTYTFAAGLSRVLAPCTSLGPDQFCIDYNSDSIYLGSDPTGRVIEYGTVGQFLSGAQSGHVTIRDMSWDEFATEGGAVTASVGWVIDGVRG